MIVDLCESPVGDLPEADLCIIGTGPAGVTLAAELAGSGLRIAVLESGRRGTSTRADALRRVLSEGIVIKDWSRERVLGGASTTWAGLSAPLDPVDMGPRPFLRGAGRTGWPVAREELLPFWEAAAERYRFAPLLLYGPEGFGALKPRGDLSLAWSELDEKVFLACSEPQDFGREWRHAFDAPGTTLYLDATVLRLSAKGDGGARRVTHAELATSGGARLSLRARVFVLATGGIENARLLLESRDLCAAGLGNEHDQVGRGLMNHPKSYHGIVRLAKPVRELPYHFGCLAQGYAGYAGLRLREDLQRERGLLNAYVRFEPLYPWSDNRGVEALVYLVKHSGGLFGAWKRRQGGKLVSLRDYSETGDDSELQNERKTALDIVKLCGLVLLNLPMVLRYAVSRTVAGRAPPVRAIRLRNFMEMEPDPANRVLLSNERDAFGGSVPLVRHQSTEADRRSLVELHRVLARELQANGFGVLDTSLERVPHWPIDQDASHHLGTTAMGRDPGASVVTPDLRLHGAANVYCAGGSVFPTSGCANPTFTIVALSIRLAEHLRGVLGLAGGAPAVATVAGAATAAGTTTSGTALGARASRARGSHADLSSVARAYDGPRPCLRVAVIGAGKRVAGDVLPALCALPGRFAIEGVFARGRHAVLSAGRTFHSEELPALDAARLARCDLVYLAVSKEAVPSVLERLAAFDLSRTDLLVDTPVLLFKHLAHRRRFAAFRSAWVAEDCALLPWFDALEAARDAGLTGAPQRIELHRSAWRYHALAMLRTLLDDRELRAARKRRIAGEGGATHRTELRFARGGEGLLLEPRDYARGHFVVSDGCTVVTDAPAATAGPGPGASRRTGGQAGPGAGGDGAVLQLLPVLEGSACTGFRIGDVRTTLQPVESGLLGAWHAGQSVTARMEDCKRVGLHRMLLAIHEGGGGYPLDDALDDMLADYFLEKLGRAMPRALLSLRAAPGRALLGSAARLLGGR
jgi:choline dehydrogenase-like flavoprotein